ncbi:MAG: ATP-binding protein [Bacteroidetes bacterium]|nr:ATP-binding protein [Bacteroidota bacterium]
MKRIVIIGPESTGKTILSKNLAENFKTVWVPEYARKYVENLKRPYNYGDLIKISEKQIKEFNNNYSDVNKFIFFDTYLIITKIWFQVVYNKFPLFLDIEIKKSNIDLFLLCNTDIKWKPDGVRENPDKREELYNLYKTELENYNFNYKIISGVGKKRFENALKFLNELK